MIKNKSKIGRGIFDKLTSLTSTCVQDYDKFVESKGNKNIVNDTFQKFIDTNNAFKLFLGKDEKDHKDFAKIERMKDIILEVSKMADKTACKDEVNKKNTERYQHATTTTFTGFIEDYINDANKAINEMNKLMTSGACRLSSEILSYKDLFNKIKENTQVVSNNNVDNIMEYILLHCMLIYDRDKGDKELFYNGIELFKEFINYRGVNGISKSNYIRNKSYYYTIEEGEEVHIFLTISGPNIDAKVVGGGEGELDNNLDNLFEYSQLNSNSKASRDNAFSGQMNATFDIMTRDSVLEDNYNKLFSDKNLENLENIDKIRSDLWTFIQTFNTSLVTTSSILYAIQKILPGYIKSIIANKDKNIFLHVYGYSYAGGPAIITGIILNKFIKLIRDNNENVKVICRVLSPKKFIKNMGGFKGFMEPLDFAWISTKDDPQLYSSFPPGLEQFPDDEKHILLEEDKLAGALLVGSKHYIYTNNQLSENNNKIKFKYINYFDGKNQRPTIFIVNPNYIDHELCVQGGGELKVAQLKKLAKIYKIKNSSKMDKETLKKEIRKIQLKEIRKFKNDKIKKIKNIKK